jgi:hypothetical protein
MVRALQHERGVRQIVTGFARVRTIRNPGRGVAVKVSEHGLFVHSFTGQPAERHPLRTPQKRCGRRSA